MRSSHASYPWFRPEPPSNDCTAFPVCSGVSRTVSMNPPVTFSASVTKFVSLKGGVARGAAWLPTRKRPDPSPPSAVAATAELSLRAPVLPGGAREEAAGTVGRRRHRVQLTHGQRDFLFLQLVGNFPRFQCLQDLPTGETSNRQAHGRLVNSAVVTTQQSCWWIKKM